MPDSVILPSAVRPTLPPSYEALIGSEYAADLRDPENMHHEVMYDPATKMYYFYTRIGDKVAVVPMQLTPGDYNSLSFRQGMMEYFKQRIKAGEVGSSAMPHKVNPIDFENAEGNFGIANAIYEHLASKLPLSRLQRDLTDSTVLRNVGVPMAHSLIGLRSLLKGLNKLLLNREALDCDLENNWAVVAEGIQTVLRRAGYPSPYEALKALTRTNAHITRESIAEFIESLDVAESVKQELRAITPQSYTGVFE